MKRWMLLLLLCSLACPAMAHAGPLEYRYFSRIPVLHEGRLKPLESFARITLRQMAGSETLNGQPPEAWLATMLFDPAAALEMELLHVPSADLRHSLQLPERKSNRYRLEEVRHAIGQQPELIASMMRKDEHALSSMDRELLQLHTRLTEATMLIRSFSLVMPFTATLSTELHTELRLPEGGLDYLALAKVKDVLHQQVKDTAAAKPIERYTPLEQEKAMLSMHVQAMETAGADNHLLRVLPSPWHAGEWLTPWAMVMEGKAAPESGARLEQWRALAVAYGAGDAASWRRISHELHAHAPAPHWKLELEHWYYALHLVEVATALYALAFLLLFLKRESRRQPVMLAALAVHGFLLLARILILGRPPVSTLYESILFVSFITAMGAFLWPGAAFRNERRMAASALSALLLAISGAYATDGDTMGVLVAVLNTNFWLATHVICIAAGYGWCLIAGTLAHFWLLRHARLGKKLPASPPAYLQILAIVALLFTALGTILGGIWADQSWGRFWGWDPKENGALLIVLWLAWVLHGRISGHFRAAGFAALLAFVNVIVALSWFGVNLLNTGLHSYGFTSSAAFGLAAFCAAELMFITTTYGLARRNAT